MDYTAKSKINARNTNAALRVIWYQGESDSKKIYTGGNTFSLSVKRKEKSLINFIFIRLLQPPDEGSSSIEVKIA